MLRKLGIGPENSLFESKIDLIRGLLEISESGTVPVIGVFEIINDSRFDISPKDSGTVLNRASLVKAISLRSLNSDSSLGSVPYRPFPL
mmetsp:Transcript_2965/g.4322  ORF Transcript_2965/g.4322 Transcript_2965/m.4322 type:complete len:89 (-) Transcript_2965:511-777(-)